MGAVGVSFSPIGRAFARRLGGGHSESEVADLRAEIADLRQRLAETEARLGGDVDELHNRVDFAERLLAQQKAQHGLPGAR
jgi:hypothetical protein